MLQYDTSLRASLNAASSQKNWSDRLQAGLGAAPKLRCYREAVQSADTVANGVKVFEADVSGGMVISGGNVVSFGTVVNATVNLGADLSSGYTILRIEGNGSWVQGALGLTGSSADFKVIKSPTPSSGWGFAGLSISPPAGLPSGTGPNMPALDVDAPYRIELEDWTNPASPVVVGSLVFNDARPPFIFEDAELAAECGDIRVTQSTQSIVFGEFEFGATLLSMSQRVNNDAARPLHQVLVYCKPYGTPWASYPACDTFDSALITTFPGPFKVRIKKANGAVLYTHEMHDGLPINSPQLSQERTDTLALRPAFNCGQVLPWESHTPKLSSRASKYIPPMRPDSIRQSQCKISSAVNPWVPLLASGQVKSLLHYYAAPPWPLPTATSFVAQDPNNDPYLYTVNNYSGDAVAASTYRAGRASGWKWEPGSMSGHDWYAAPGGQRFERAAFPTPLVLFLSDPAGAYLKDGSSYAERVRHWMLAYFNHSCYYIRDVKRMTSIPTQEVLDGRWTYTDSYYSPRGTFFPTNAPDKSRNISLTAARNGIIRDKAGHLVWNGWITDHHHAYRAPGVFALIFNSPMMAVASKFHLHAMHLAQIGWAPTNKTNGFLYRTHAWRWFSWAIAWKLASKHPDFGVSRAQIEKRFEQDLQVIYSTYVYPATTPSDPGYDSKHSQCLRAYGQLVYTGTTENIPAAIPGALNSSKYVYATSSHGLVYYMAQVLLLMKTTGSLAAMRARSTMCRTTIDFIVECLDRFSIDFILATDGVFEAINDDSYGTPITPESSSNPPAWVTPVSWYDWRQRIYPPSVTGLRSMVTDASGKLVEPPVCAHLRAQYVFLRRDWLTEFTTSQEQQDKINEACAKYEGYYQKFTDAVNAASTPQAKANTDFGHRTPSLGLFEPPVTE